MKRNWQLIEIKPAKTVDDQGSGSANIALNLIVMSEQNFLCELGLNTGSVQTSQFWRSQANEIVGD